MFDQGVQLQIQINQINQTNQCATLKLISPFIRQTSTNGCMFYLCKYRSGRGSLIQMAFSPSNSFRLGELYVMDDIERYNWVSVLSSIGPNDPELR